MMRTPQSQREAPDIASFTRHCEHDGMLRAYANRAMFLAILFAMIALSSLWFAIYVRVQPPTVIGVEKDGNAAVVGVGARQDLTAQMAMVLSAQAAGADATASEGVAPTDLERQSGRAAVPRTLPSCTPDSAPRNLAESLSPLTERTAQETSFNESTWQADGTGSMGRCNHQKISRFGPDATLGR